MHQQREEEITYTCAQYEERIHQLTTTLRKAVKDEASLADVLKDRRKSQDSQSLLERRKSDIQIKASIFDEIKAEITKEMSSKRPVVEVPDLPTFDGELSSSEHFFYLVATQGYVDLFRQLVLLK